jgi:hypothetical protein
MKEAVHPLEGLYRNTANIIEGSNATTKKEGPILYKVQPVGESSCVFSSLISVMHYINDYHCRDMLMNFQPNSLSSKQLFAKKFINSENYAAKLINENGKYQLKSIYKFDVLHDISIWPTLCILRGLDRSVALLLLSLTTIYLTVQ